MIQNKLLKIEVIGTGIVIPIYFSADGIQIKSNDSITPDVVMKGTPLSLLRMAMTRENRKSFFINDIVLEGNLELAQQMVDRFDEFNIDWEERLSKWIGDVPAYHVGKVFQKFNRWRKNTSESLWQNMNEYLHEEISLTPPSEELKDFFEEIDVLRMDVDRLTARIEKIRGIS